MSTEKRLSPRPILNTASLPILTTFFNHLTTNFDHKAKIWWTRPAKTRSFEKTNHIIQEKVSFECKNEVVVDKQPTG
jgi:hypothetical protein